MSSNSDIVISIKDLTHKYGRVCAVDGVSLDIRKGITIGLVGADGVGKSTLLS